MIHRMDRAGRPDGRADARHDRADARPARPAAARRRALGLRDQVGRRARDLPTPSPGACASSARNRNDITPRYPELRAPQPRAELAPRDPRRRDRRLRRRSGRPSFGALQRRMHVGSESAQARGWPRSCRSTYVIFDLLWLDGHSLMRPALRRAPRARWRELGLDRASAGRRPTTSSAHGARAAGGDHGAGARGRRRQAPRLPATSPGGAHGAWIKIKNVTRQEVVDRRLDAGRGPARRTGSARCSSASREDGALRYAGRVGTGFTAGRARPARARCSGRCARRLAVRARRAEDRRASAVFVEPQLVAEVEFTRVDARTAQLRAPVLQGPARRQARPTSSSPRTAPSATARGRVGGRELKLSNLDKVLYPEAGFTKRDVIDYYVAHRAGAAAAPRRAAR